MLLYHYYYSIIIVTETNPGHKPKRELGHSYDYVNKFCEDMHFFMTTIENDCISAAIDVYGDPYAGNEEEETQDSEGDEEAEEENEDDQDDQDEE